MSDTTIGGLLAIGGISAAVFLLAAVAQAVSGFGSALVAVPLLTLVIRPDHAVVAATVVGVLLTGLAWGRERAHVDVPLVRRLTLAGLLGMPLGLVVLTRANPRVLSTLIAAGLLVVVVLLARNVRLPSGPRGQWGSGITAGALLASTGMNGPPLVLTLQGAGLPAREFRATLQAVFFGQDLIVVVAFAALGYANPTTLAASVGGCLGVPLGWRLGDVVFHRLAPATFRRIVLGGLALTALVALGAAARG